MPIAGSTTVKGETTMTSPRTLSLTALAALSVSAVPVMADSTLTMNDSTVVQIRNGMARMDPAGDSTYMLYDAGRNMLIDVDPGEGTYMELDDQFMQRQAEAMGSMREEMAAQMEAMRSQLQNMPEEQRRMMEQRMDAMMGAAGDDQTAARPDIKTVKKGSREVNGFKCNDYQLLEGKNPVADVCIAEKAGAGMSGDDFATLSAMMTFMRSMARQASEMAGPAAGGFDPSVMADVEGFPIEMKDHRSGEQYGVASVANDKLSDAPFTDYRKLRKDVIPEMPDR
jgi:hypothetical protein